MTHETRSMETDAHKRGLPIPLKPGDRIYMSKDGVSAPIEFRSYVKKTGLVRYVMLPTDEEVESGVAAFSKMLEDVDFKVERKSNRLDERYNRLIRNLSISGEIHEETVRDECPDGFIERLHEDERIEYSEGYKSFAYVG
ncbi:hypothetical protein M199_gp150 [Halogranum tailed virus 1]|uniref:Uncharacterized protein n=1 Tax=Halogranum tailed virus 1 TaxID=1273749 RepID=R4TGW4_9CAUD|nr:hypothetical protein M199_gp150 [Halogranum tailed virus 1]AGM11516.1 hypothetical protein HGTV1_219 [Halogranum tailed virus 1]